MMSVSGFFLFTLLAKKSIILQKTLNIHQLLLLFKIFCDIIILIGNISVSILECDLHDVVEFAPDKKDE